MANPSVSTSTSADKEIECDLDNEFTEEDESVLKGLNLSEEQLRLKKENVAEFWKSVAEMIRSNLNDCLEDNQELERLRNMIQEENEELVKERNKLLKLANDAREIYNELKS